MRQGRKMKVTKEYIRQLIKEELGSGFDHMDDVAFGYKKWAEKNEKTAEDEEVLRYYIDGAFSNLSDDERNDLEEKIRPMLGLPPMGR